MQSKNVAKIAALNLAAFCLGPAGFSQIGVGGAGGRLETVPVGETRPSSGPHSSQLGNSDRAGNRATISPWQNETAQSPIRTLEELKGTAVAGRDGDELGKLDDLLVDTRSGKLVGVVVSSGGVLGVGSELRVVPVDQFSPAGGDGDLQVTIAKQEFQALPVATDDSLNRGAAAIVRSGTSSVPSVEGSGTTEASDSQGNIVRAGTLKGKDLRAGGREAGKIDDVAVNLEQRRVMAVVEADRGFGGESGKFVVPFDRLDIGANDSDLIAADLNRADFAGNQGPRATTEHTNREGVGRVAEASSARVADRARRDDVGRDVPAVAANAERSDRSSAGDRTAGGTGATAGSSRAAPPVDLGVTRDPEELTPTGRGSGQSAQENAELARAARSVRSALDNDRALARVGVRVLAEEDKVVLRGSVDSEETRKRVEQLARDTVTAEIDNQITLHDQ